jgi:hypothetical protein
VVFSIGIFTRKDFKFPDILDLLFKGIQGGCLSRYRRARYDYHSVIGLLMVLKGFYTSRTLKPSSSKLIRLFGFKILITTIQPYSAGMLEGLFLSIVQQWRWNIFHLRLIGDFSFMWDKIFIWTIKCLYIQDRKKITLAE